MLHEVCQPPTSASDASIATVVSTEAADAAAPALAPSDAAGDSAGDPPLASASRL
jgi:hypothetical protein